MFFPEVSPHTTKLVHMLYKSVIDLSPCAEFQHSYMKSDIHTGKLCSIFSSKFCRILLKWVLLGVSCLASEWMIIVFEHNIKRQTAGRLILLSCPHCFRIRHGYTESEWTPALYVLYRQSEIVWAIWIDASIIHATGAISQSVESICGSHVIFNKKGWWKAENRCRRVWETRNLITMAL